VRSAAIALLFLSAAATADVVSTAPETVRVTLYGNDDPSRSHDSNVFYEAPTGADDAGLVMVSETRTIGLPAGTSRIVFLGVADAIVPQTADVEGLPATILESNFDYDLLTHGAVIAKSHGERVREIRTDAATGRTTDREAILRSGPQGVMLEIDGKIETLGCSGLNEKLVFPHIPVGLAAQPQLSMTVRAETAGKHTVELSYLALGMKWSAAYIARIDEGEGTLDLTGWLTLVNQSGTTFASTPAEVVAGQLARDKEETQPPGPAQVTDSPSCWPVGQFAKFAAAAPMFRERSFLAGAANVQRHSMALQDVIVTGTQLSLQARMRELGDYKLYAVPEPTTIAARQSKQVQFLSQADVPFQRIYMFKADEQSMVESKLAPQPATALLRLENKESEGLGKPLPRGVVSVMETGGGGAVLAGQDRLDDTPVGLPIELELGQAMDVWVEPRVTQDETIESEHNEQRASVEVRLRNDKPVPITLEYRQPRIGENFRIVQESRSHTLKDGDFRWTIRLRPGGRAVLRYSMQRD
jgi:hypothetical protein